MKIFIRQQVNITYNLRSRHHHRQLIRKTVHINEHLFYFLKFNLILFYFILSQVWFYEYVYSHKRDIKTVKNKITIRDKNKRKKKYK